MTPYSSHSHFQCIHSTTIKQETTPPNIKSKIKHTWMATYLFCILLCSVQAVMMPIYPTRRHDNRWREPSLPQLGITPKDTAPILNSPPSLFYRAPFPFILHSSSRFRASPQCSAASSPHTHNARHQRHSFTHTLTDRAFVLFLLYLHYLLPFTPRCHRTFLAIQNEMYKTILHSPQTTPSPTSQTTLHH